MMLQFDCHHCTATELLGPNLTGTVRTYTEDDITYRVIVECPCGAEFPMDCDALTYSYATMILTNRRAAGRRELHRAFDQIVREL